MSEGKVSTTRVAALGFALVWIGALGFHEIPGMIAEDAEGTKWVNAVYCSIITLTTVGFGDICPGEITGFGRTFIVLLTFSGLGMFCGPIMDLAASWKDKLHVSGTVALLSTTIATSVFLFSYLLEEMSESEAAYFSIITGTTIGYGDIRPKSDAGKIAVALYAILAVNVVASLLEPAKDFLLSFCMLPPPASGEDEDMKSKATTKKTKSKKSTKTTNDGKKSDDKKDQQKESSKEDGTVEKDETAKEDVKEETETKKDK